AVIFGPIHQASGHSLVYFFFQAEDGIRVRNVTGVQTCALPISDASEWELVSMGYRNTYDAAVSPEGELFTYDNDMEWDMGLPWYRPTRILHAVSGSDYGWRSGRGKWKAYYEDS